MLDRNIEGALSYFLAKGNIDFLHGAIGLGFYYEMRAHDGYCAKSLERLVDYLYTHAIVGKIEDNDDFLVKFTFDSKDPQKRFNIALAHGISSAAILLGRVLQLDISQSTSDKCRFLLRGIGNYLMSQQIDVDKYGCFFPTFPISEENACIFRSRLAWCYGDIGIAMALKSIGRAIEYDECSILSDEVSSYTASHRRNLTTNMVKDACICHGASGIAQYFKSLIADDGNDVNYRNAYGYWREISLGLGQEIDGMLQFPVFDPTTKNWRPENGILDGNAGVGLMLLGADNILNKILLYD